MPRCPASSQASRSPIGTISPSHLSLHGRPLCWGASTETRSDMSLVLFSRPQHLGAEQIPDAVAVFAVGGCLFDLDIARARQIDRDIGFDAAGPCREDDDAIRKIDRFLDIVRDEQHGFA